MQMHVRRTSIPEVLDRRARGLRGRAGLLHGGLSGGPLRRDADLGLPSSFVQLNHSRSARGVVRGLHFQWDPPMGKLMRVARGEAFIVAVDIRPGLADARAATSRSWPATEPAAALGADILRTRVLRALGRRSTWST